MRYVPTSAGSPVKVLSRAEKRDVLGLQNSVLNNPPGKTTIYRKVQDRSKSEPFYRELKEEIVRESDHTITLKNRKTIRKSDLAIKRQPALKKPSPRKRNQLVKFYATKGLRKTTKPQRKETSRLNLKNSILRGGTRWWIVLERHSLERRRSNGKGSDSRLASNVTTSQARWVNLTIQEFVKTNTERRTIQQKTHQTTKQAI